MTLTMNRVARKPIAFLAAMLFGAVASAAAPGQAEKDAMHADHAKVGHKAPNFTLTDLEGKEHTLADYTKDGKIVVLEWFNAGCPFVKKHYRTDTMTMNNLAKEFSDDNVVWLRVNSGAPGKQGAGLEYNKEVAQNWNITGPILLDESGKVGKMYNAKNTPAMAVIHADGTLAYWGAIDDDRGAQNAGATNYVKDALTALVNGETVKVAETKPYGCSVKY